jgi:uncharacterized lipoprotein YmbA
VKKKLIAAAIIAAAGLSACASDADVASRNISTAADQFEVDRRIVFFNGITDEYLLTIEGRCSIEADAADAQLEVTCKVEGGYRKHFLGLSDNVSYLVEHLTPTDVSTTQYRVIFKPETIVPDVDRP